MIVIKRPSLFDHWPITIKISFLLSADFPILPRSDEDKLPAIGYGDTACFFRNNNSMSIRLLRDSHCCAMSQAKFFRYIQIMGYRKNTSCRLDTFLLITIAPSCNGLFLKNIFSIKRWLIAASISSPVRTTSSKGTLCSMTINAPTFCFPIFKQAITTGMISSCFNDSFFEPLKRRASALTCR